MAKQRRTRASKTKNCWHRHSSHMNLWPTQNNIAWKKNRVSPHCVVCHHIMMGSHPDIYGCVYMCGWWWQRRKVMHTHGDKCDERKEREMIVLEYHPRTPHRRAMVNYGGQHYDDDNQGWCHPAAYYCMCMYILCCVVENRCGGELTKKTWEDVYYIMVLWNRREKSSREDNNIGGCGILCGAE